MQETINNLVQYMTDFLQSGGYPVGFLIVFLESIFPIVPLPIPIALNLIAFGNVAGFTLSYIATICGCFASYMIFYYLSKTKLIQKILNNKKFKIDSLTNTIKNISLSKLTIISAIPFTPAFLINIVAGITKLPKRKFIIAILVSKIFVVYFWGFIGKSLLESFTDIKTITTIVIFLIVFYVISKILEKKFDV